MDNWSGFGGYYQRWLSRVYQFITSPGQRVLELGCGQGDLLAALRPRFGVGLDFSGEMVRRAAARYPSLHFVRADGNQLCLSCEFDYVILSDLVNDAWDVQAILEQVRTVCTERTRLVLNTYSKLWELPLAITRRLGLSKQVLEQNWLTVDDLRNLLALAGFEVIKQWPEMTFPLDLPLAGELMNRFMARIWPFSQLSITNFILARPQPGTSLAGRKPLVSVIVPARNEVGNIEGILRRTPSMGSGTELVFVEGHSHDGTYEAIMELTRRYPEQPVKVLRQLGEGKGDAVRLGFSQAGGELLLILDADLTVPPEALPRFYEALVSGQGEFVNGVRLVYPFEKGAMRFTNLVGNKLFGMLFSWLLGQPTKDTLCGTKGLWRDDYLQIELNRDYFGDFDPFGDFDLLFGAAKLGLKIVDMPVRYRPRSYGKTNISRWKHGWLLLQMGAFGMFRLKFV
jgi:SAM-dependent methyltransferase